MADEEVAPARQGYLTDDAFLFGKRFGQRCGCFARQFGRRRLDDDKNQFVAVKCRLEGQFASTPIEIWRKQGCNIGVDREMP